ncbi:MAG: hypothetical protein ACP5N7_05815 [Candidatus Pacearchaeota archaeon]
METIKDGDMQRYDNAIAEKQKVLDELQSLIIEAEKVGIEIEVKDVPALEEVIDIK